MVALTKINLSFLKFSPFLYRMFEDLSTIDYLGYIVAVLIFIYFKKTVSGFHHLSVGISGTAADSLGVKSQRIQIRRWSSPASCVGLEGGARHGQCDGLRRKHDQRSRFHRHGGREHGPITSAGGHRLLSLLRDDAFALQDAAGVYQLVLHLSDSVSLHRLGNHGVWSDRHDAEKKASYEGVRMLYGL